MRDNYDFSDAVKNPFAGKLNGKYTVTIHYDLSENKQALTNEEKAVVKRGCKFPQDEQNFRNEIASQQ